MNLLGLLTLVAAAASQEVRPAATPYVALPVADAGIAVEQTIHGTKPGPQLVEGFDGLGLGFSGPQGVARVRNPSDNSLAVGPNHIVQTVNGAGMAVFTKKGTMFDTTGKALYGPVRANNVFRGFGGNCEARNSGDVVVRYDQLADRWLIVLPLFSRGPVRPDQVEPVPPGVSQLSVPGVANQPGPAVVLYQPPPGTSTPAPAAGPRPSPGPLGPYSMCYAISGTPDPLGPYYRYEFLRPLFPDYPRPAVWIDGYYVPTSTSDDRISTTVATEKHACVVDRAKMLKGQPATEQCVIVHDVNFLNNADIDGRNLPPKGAPNIMMAAGGRQLDRILEDDIVNVWRFHVDWKDPSKTALIGPQAIKVAPYHYLCGGQLTYCVPQPGSELRLDAQGDKLMARLTYRNVNGHESLVAAHSIDTAAGGGGVRWYEFRVDANRGKTRNVSLYQQGTYAPEGFYRWMPSPVMDRLGNLGIGYSFGGSPHFPGQRFAGRERGDPLGQLTLRETILVEGEAADGGPGDGRPRPQRWQDYTQTAVDPTDDCTIWYVGDYVRKGATSYSTRIGAFRMPGCPGDRKRPRR